MPGQSKEAEVLHQASGQPPSNEQIVWRQGYGGIRSTTTRVEGPAPAQAGSAEQTPPSPPAVASA